MGGAENAIPILREILVKIQESNFLKGDNKLGWRASFDWLFENGKNWVKVYEGNYRNIVNGGDNSVPAQKVSQTKFNEF